jgi:hypothetical protein
MSPPLEARFSSWKFCAWVQLASRRFIRTPQSLLFLSDSELKEKKIMVVTVSKA